MQNPFRFDACFVVSVAALRELTQEVSNDSVRWYLGEVTPTHVSIGCSNPEEPGGLPNDIIYRFPIIGNVGLFELFDPEDGLMVALHEYAFEEVQGGLYVEDGSIKTDPCGDWEVFWPPLEAALREKTPNLLKLRDPSAPATD